MCRFLCRDVTVGNHPEFREKESSVLLCCDLRYIPSVHRGQTGPVVQVIPQSWDPAGESVPQHLLVLSDFRQLLWALADFAGGLMWSGKNAPKTKLLPKMKPSWNTSLLFRGHNGYLPPAELLMCTCTSAVLSQKVKYTAFGKGGRIVQRGSRIFI